MACLTSELFSFSFIQMSAYQVPSPTQGLKVQVLVTQLGPTLCNPMDRSTPVHGILQARILEWVAFPSPGDLLDPGAEDKTMNKIIKSLFSWS